LNEFYAIRIIQRSNINSFPSSEILSLTGFSGKGEVDKLITLFFRSYSCFSLSLVKEVEKKKIEKKDWSERLFWCQLIYTDRS
jgi:hypothetical protein